MKLLILISLDEWVALAYAFVSMVGFIGYVPQIWALIRAKSASEEMSASMWLIWFVENFVAMLYSIIILKDWLVILFAALDVAAVLTIFMLVIYNRCIRFKAVPALQPVKLKA